MPPSFLHRINGVTGPLSSLLALSVSGINLACTISFCTFSWIFSATNRRETILTVSCFSKKRKGFIFCYVQLWIMQILMRKNFLFNSCFFPPFIVIAKFFPCLMLKLVEPSEAQFPWRILYCCDLILLIFFWCVGFLYTIIVQFRFEDLRSEKKTKIGGALSGALVSTLVGLAASNLGLISSEAPAFSIVLEYLLPAAVPLLLFRADMRRVIKSTGALLLAFLLGSGNASHYTGWLWKWGIK